MMKTIRITTSLLLCWLAATAVADEPMRAPATDAALLDHLSQGIDQGVPWLSGGIGENERRAIMETVAAEYSLKLEFALADGSYLGDVDVVIEDGAGQTVLAVSSPGPWLLTDLPSGTYQVRAAIEGRPALERTVSVPSSGMETAVFNVWAGEKPNSAADGQPLPGR